jgi:hypothetical protein
MNIKNDNDRVVQKNYIIYIEMFVGSYLVVLNMNKFN